MSAEVAADRPPDSEADWCVERGSTPVGKTSNRPNHESDPQPASTGTARAAGGTLTSFRVTALPILEGILKRIRLEAFLRDHLPREDARSRVATATGLMVLVRIS
jgi:hypothetical protein